MARSEARLQFGMWLKGLAGYSAHAKLMYAVLLTEDTINQCGVGRLSPPKWAREASLTMSETEKALAELQSGDPLAAPVTIDEDTYEVLVRSLIRNDKVAEQPFVLKAALESAGRVNSGLLRWVLAQELRKLPPKQPDGVSKRGTKIVYPDPHACADVLDPPGAVPPQDPSRTLLEPSEDPSETLFEPSSDPASEKPFSDPARREHGSGGGDGSGSSSCRVGSSVSSDADATDASEAASDKPKGRRTTSADEPDGFAKWYAAFPRHEARVKAASAYRSALRKRGVTQESLLAGARTYARLVQAEARERSKILLPPSWLNGERWNDEIPADGSAGPRRDVWAAPDSELTDEDVDEILGPDRPPEPPDEFEFWDRERRHTWNRENVRQWQASRRERAQHVRAERRARVTRLDDHRRSAG